MISNLKPDLSRNLNFPQPLGGRGADIRGEFDHIELLYACFCAARIAGYWSLQIWLGEWFRNS
jgi:hypothetical protein